MANDATARLQCAVCDEAVEDAGLLSECLECGRRFHLNPYSNRPGKDCGDAVIGEALGVETFCQPCIDGFRETEGADPGRSAEAMLQGLYGGMLPLPPQHEPPDGGTPQGGQPPVEPPPRGRRRFRRVDS